MSTWISLVASCAALACFVTEAPAQAKREPAPRFKGVEMYSWKDAKGEWVFALLDGTNREKTTAEIKEKKNQIAGVAKLKTALGLLAEKEMVFWSHTITGFEFPPKAVLDDVKKAAKAAKLELTASE